ncbi:type II secretion system minor pseudopilin GspK [Pseudoduganella namucuonensis]|uniref:Type II secretion system protein K n=1 Tax=Pseudoduganella namucuonensis TaxID=1035707 RepID=A0A1I7LKK8_9BURK|nr:type II secretion system minor pseudopilin GspK [Pseudoduganella namucuonensis]SFV10246.1 type II secretion system protein K (GspK) [Pseudoduganella namucuonensis]
MTAQLGFRSRFRAPGRQRGVAIITALLLTTLAVTIVASLFWQQQVQVRSIENQRLHLQTKWILRGALDWARLILQQDDRDSSITAETSVWATALAETRLDDYVERERTDNERYDATLSGQITDAQARYNLANLAADRLLDAGQVAVFGKLLENLQLNPALAKAVAERVARSQKGKAPDTGGTAPPAGTPQPVGTDGTEPVELMRVEDLLAVSGFTQQGIERLREFVVVLPDTGTGVTAINVNMAKPELLAALVENYSVSEAASLVQFRKRTPFLRTDDFKAALTGKTLRSDKITVKSDFFLVLSHIRLGRAALDAESLIRRANKQATLVWIREN